MTLLRSTRKEEAARAAINSFTIGGPVEIPAEMWAAALQRAMAFDTAGTQTAQGTCSP